MSIADEPVVDLTSRPNTEPVRETVRETVRGAQPSARLGEIVDLLDELAGVKRASEQLLAGVELATGLRLGELQALAAVGAGAVHARDVARRTGQADDAARATVSGLVRRGLLARHQHPSAPAGAAEPSLLHVTDLGRVTLAQAEGLEVRLADALVDALGLHGATGFRTAVRALGSALETGPADGDQLVAPA